jgi:ribose transport system substrate-binding protein
MLKRWLTLWALALLGLSALAATGCGSSGGGSGADKEIVIGWTPPDITGVFKTATDYFEKSAADANNHGFNVKVLSRAPAAHTDFADQLAIIEDYISRKVDVIAISPADTEAVKPAIKRANQAGIPVIMVNLLEPQKDIDIESYIGFDNSDAASVSAYAVLDYYGGPGVLGTGPKVKVKPSTFLDLKWWKKTYANADKQAPKASGALIEGIAGTFFSQERLDGFNEVMKQYPNMRILGKPLAADWNREKGVKAAENFLSRYSPRQMNYIWAASNEMGIGAINATQRKGELDTQGGLKPPPKGKVAIFTNDNTPESTNLIRSGKLIAETTHGFPEWGWYGTKFAVMTACGEKVPKKFDIRPRTVYQGNADRFYPNPALPKIDWATVKKGCK